MKSEWHDIIFDVNYKLQPAYFVMKCVNDKIEQRLEIWKDIIYGSFGDNLPCIWKDFIDKRKLIHFADPEILPLGGFYEITNIKENGLPVALTSVTFDRVNLSASVDLLCVNNEFSKNHPLLSGRIARQIIHKLDEIFEKLKPIYVILLISEWNTGINSVVRSIDYKMQGFLPYYFLIQSYGKPRRKGVFMWDKLYGEVEKWSV